jgi:3-methyl-2-oxobutanoate hydroxymethyltransferase
VRAKEEEEANKLKNDALLLQDAKCFALVLEKIPAALAKKVASSLSIPAIGIGAGSGCDGQVLVMHDLLGINNEFNPRFVRKYLNLHALVTDAFRNYHNDVKKGSFPSEEESY